MIRIDQFKVRCCMSHPLNKADREERAKLKAKHRCSNNTLGHSFNDRKNTTTPCSCYMCGNPRKFNGNGINGKTRQELIFDTSET